MTYAAFDSTKPVDTQTGPAFAQSTRDNLLAIRDMVVMGCLPGWNFSQSGGTPDQPAVLLYSRGTERIRASLTWGTVGGADGNVEVSVFAYSSNSGGAYDTIGTETITYDADANVTASTWS